MPSTTSISDDTMSPEELAACEDFLDSHREYALDLLSDIEGIRQYHKADSCPETRAGHACLLCELCSDNSLFGATKKVLETYEDAENHLREVRASFGKNAPIRGPPGPETLFKSQLAKAVFLCIITTGESLRSLHATWQGRLQNVVTNPSLPTPTVQDVNTGSGKNGKGKALFPVRLAPTTIHPKLFPVTLPDSFTSGSSTFLIFRRCLSSDCPCEANKENAGSSVNSKGACGSQCTSKASSSSWDAKKTRKSKKTTSLTTKPGDRSKKTSDMPGTFAHPRTDKQTEGPETRVFGARDLQDSREHEATGFKLTSNTASLTQDSETSLPSARSEILLVDPRIFRLRAELERSDVACRALMSWCRAWITERQLDPCERPATIESTHESSFAFEEAGPPQWRCVGRASTKELWHSNKMTAKDAQFNSGQEELKARWLMARQERRKDKKRHGSRLRVL